MSFDTDSETKKAWRDNWAPIGMDDILRIFSYPRVKKKMDILLPCLDKSMKILEGGCGLGPYLIYLKKQGYDVVGLDYNPEPLKKIKEYDSSIDVRCGDVQALPFNDGYFGAYISLGVIEHFSEGPEKAIKEAYRVLKKGGCFFVEVPRASIFYRIKYPLNKLKRMAFLRRLMKKAPKTYYWEQYFDISVLKSKMEDAGFRVEKIHPMDHEHALLTFSEIFRDKNTYDGINRIGLRISSFFESYLPWVTAGQMIFICRKE